MKIAIACVLIAYFIPYICTVLAKAGGKGMNNHCPRVYLQNLTGWRQRANWAQMNNFENFAPFGVAVVLALLLKADPNQVDILAIAFVLFRILHAICYLLDAAPLRSLVWFGAQACIVWLFVLSLNLSTF